MRALARKEVELPENWWLDFSLGGGVEKRIGWYDFEIYWFVVCFKDGTRGPVTYGTQNDPGDWIGTRYGR